MHHPGMITAEEHPQRTQSLFAGEFERLSRQICGQE
jgi:hypothetical protein